MLVLRYETKEGKELKRAVANELVLEVEPDPRPNAKSKTIVKLKTGEKLYCLNSFEDLVK